MTFLYFYINIFNLFKIKKTNHYNTNILIGKLIKQLYSLQLYMFYVG